jgi:arsenate reductase-like glutaredoxin family protein
VPLLAQVTTSGCKYCKRAKEALRANNIPYAEIEVQGDVQLLTKFREASGLRTVPQVLPQCLDTTIRYNLPHQPEYDALSALGQVR